MIRINLLREPSRPKSAFASESRYSLLLLGALVLAAAVLGAWRWNLTSELAEKQTRIQELEKESLRLKELRAELKRYQDRKAELERRLAAIERLKKNQTGPVNLMNSLIASVPDEPRLWLSSLTQRGNAVTIEGDAFDVPSIAGFIARLAGRPPFSNVDLDFWEQQPDSLKFKLSCQVENK